MTAPSTVGDTDQRSRRRQVGVLYAAGFITAFGAHAVAANLGRYAGDRHASLVELGVLLALYDGAEVLLKPVFGVVADRVGCRTVLVGGLLGFAIASAAFVLAGEPDALGLARLAQGASAAAFSPAAGAMVASLGGGRARGRTFGGYGAAKGLGYVAGPVLGSAIVVAGGYFWLFALLAVAAVAVAVASLVFVPAHRPTRRPRQTLVALVRRLGQPSFVRPTLALGAATAALSAAVGFLPVVGARSHLGPLVTGAAVSLVACTAALVQPWAGRALDAGRLSETAGLTAGLAASAFGFTLAAGFTVAGLFIAAGLIGLGVGVATPVGFAAVAGAAPPGRMGETMGAAEVGREFGDAGGPLLVGAVGAASLAGGLWALAVLLAVAATVVAATQPRRGPRRTCSMTAH